MRLHYVATAPLAIAIVLGGAKSRPEYRCGLGRRLWLGCRMFWINVRLRSGTPFRVVMAMASKLLEMPADRPGIVAECGTWKGGTAAMLSVVCRVVGRELFVFDSFAGLPAGDANDRQAAFYARGEYCGTRAEVESNLRRYGAYECCTLVPGWFQDTLPNLEHPVALCYLDVDLESSLHDCVVNLWPRLVRGGYMFIDECQFVDYCALFFSESWWRHFLGEDPPGLIGSGVGLPLGEYYVGPMDDYTLHPLQHRSTGAYTIKGMCGIWTYRPSPETRA